MQKTIIVTSALPYVNNLPHLGNIVGCVLSSDVYVRFLKKRNIRAIHICGTDEYGTASEIKAIAMKTHPKDVCDTFSKTHKEVYDWFNIKFDYFGRTSHPAHTETVHEIFNKLYSNGFFVKRQRSQYFCTKCELVLADRYVEGICYNCDYEKARGDQCDNCGLLLKAENIKNAVCALCKANPELKETEHLYLRLDALQSEVTSFCNEKSKYWTENAQKITNQWLKSGLNERCMTRDLKFKWGVPVPLPDLEYKVFYVWFDAPIGYFTFLKQYLGSEYSNIIKNSDVELHQFMGKDNVPFHSIVFPAILLGTKENYKKVDRIFATEYLMYENKKFSKSNNIGIFGNNLFGDALGPSCLWRFYLMKIRPENKDANFSVADFNACITGDLINNLGNFINRTLKYINAKMDRTIEVSQAVKDTYSRYINQEEIQENDLFSKFFLQVDMLLKRYIKEMENGELKNGIATILETSNCGNKFLQEGFLQSKKIELQQKNDLFAVSAALIYILGHMIDPYMPQSAEKIFKMIGMSNGDMPARFELLENSHKISDSIDVLFKPLTDEQSKSLNRFTG